MENKMTKEKLKDYDKIQYEGQIWAKRFASDFMFNDAPTEQPEFKIEWLPGIIGKGIVAETPEQKYISELIRISEKYK
jgi:hypothetical protein